MKTGALRVLPAPPLSGCKYHVIFIPKYRRKKLYGESRKHMCEMIHKLAVSQVIGLITEATRQILFGRAIVPVGLRATRVLTMVVAAFVPLKVSTTYRPFDSQSTF